MFISLISCNQKSEKLLLRSLFLLSETIFAELCGWCLEFACDFFQMSNQRSVLPEPCSSSTDSFGIDYFRALY
jgi:hypothetical protein